MYFEYKEELKDSIPYHAMLESMKQDIALFMENFKDDSRLISGWGHEYFCNEDGGRLLYDIRKPLEHECSICGKVYREYRYNACFVTMMRNEAVVSAVKAALLFQITSDVKYQRIAISIIDFYADHYEEFAIHAKDKINCSPLEDVGGAGKIMPQGLNEAIIGIRIVNALELMKDSLDVLWLDSIKRKMFIPMVELLIPQKMHIHNIPTWINSAIGVMGFFFRESAWIEEATRNPYNLFEQLRQGVTESGFWYEGSIHYNFFALEGVMNFFVFAKSYGYEIEDQYNQIVLHMFDAAYEYAFDNDIFPNPSDGWPNIGLKTYSYVYYMAYKVFGKPILKYLQHIEANPRMRARLPLTEPYYYANRIPLERILFAPDLEGVREESVVRRGSQNFESSNCAILRNAYFNLFFKYGHQTKSHAHPDKMNIEIMVNNQVLTKDLSNSGYASKMCNQWHRKIAAHNTCVIDGQPTDILHAGQLLNYAEDTVKASVQAYEGVIYTRELTLRGKQIEDTFTIQNKKEGCMDWFFHFETAICRNGLSLKPCDLFQEYELIQDVCEIVTNKNCVCLSQDLVLMQIVLEEGMSIYLAKTFNNPADRMRDTVIIRKQGKEAVYRTVISAKGTKDALR